MLRGCPSFAEVEMGLDSGAFSSFRVYVIGGFSGSSKEDEANASLGQWHRTTVGRVLLFNSIIPQELGFLNHTFGKKELGDLIF